jgi:hypothetical protein
MLVIKYDPDFGDVVPDGKVSSYVDQCINAARNRTLYFRVGSESILDEFRLRIARGNISPENVEFTYKGSTYKCSEYGVIVGDSIPSMSLERACAILKTAMAKRRKNVDG